jgi:two-component system response regulator AtoC
MISTKKSMSCLMAKRIIGASEAIRSVRDKISRYADHDATVLIQGASGTGKELVANHIHYLSHRRLKRFMPINCGSLPAHLIESELFGYEKGAFTGATARKLGLLELADGGTVFLDEIAELPPEAQVKLLRFLQEGEMIASAGRSISKSMCALSPRPIAMWHVPCRKRSCAKISFIASM